LIVDELLRRFQDIYTPWFRGFATRSMTRFSAKHPRVTPNMMTAVGVLGCAAAATLVYFEYLYQYVFFWAAALIWIAGSLCDIFDGALARLDEGKRATPFGSYIDSMTDRVSEGFMVIAITIVLARHYDHTVVGLGVAFVLGSFLVSYSRKTAEGMGLHGEVGFGSRAERVVGIAIGLVAAPWDGLLWLLVILTAITWYTFLKRCLHVRQQLNPDGTTIGEWIRYVLSVAVAMVSAHRLEKEHEAMNDY
jgi:phosphatidylglycerophosphate synthase